MARWTDIAPWGGPTPNQGGPAVECRGVAMHIAEGTYDGTVAWCRNPESGISAQFVAAKDGRRVQLVDTDVTAWTQAAGNGRWLSIEFEGRAGDSLTPQQVEFAAQVLARAHEVYGVPLQLADSPSGRGLGWHGMGGAAWGGHTGCPGTPIVAQRPAIIARAKQIIGGGDVSEQTDQVVYAWSQGLQKTPGGLSVEPVRWRVRDEAWQQSVTAALAALSRQVADLAAAVARPVPVAMSDGQAEQIGAAAAGQAAAVIGERLEVVEEALAAGARAELTALGRP